MTPEKKELVDAEKTVKVKKKKQADKVDDVSKTGILKKEKEVTFVNTKVTEKQALMQDAGELEAGIKIEVRSCFDYLGQDWDICFIIRN